MRKRSSDTAAIAARPARRQRSDEAESHSVCVEPIDNGYLVRRTSSKDGSYKCSTTYCPDKPKIGLEADPVGVGDESLGKAIDVAKGG